MDIASFFSKVAGAAGGGVLGGALVNLRDYVTHLSASALEKRLLAMPATQCIRANDAHGVGMHLTQTLAEAFETGERARRGLTIKVSLFV